MTNTATIPLTVFKEDKTAGLQLQDVTYSLLSDDNLSLLYSSLEGVTSPQEKAKYIKNILAERVSLFVSFKEVTDSGSYIVLRFASNSSYYDFVLGK